MSELAVGLTIGATVGASVGAAAGATIKHIDRLGKTVDELNARVLQIQQTRGLEDKIAQTGEAFRAAEERVDALGAAMRESEAPTEAMETALADAREEAARLGAVMAEQSEELGDRREALGRTGDAVEDLADRERELTGALEKQSRQLHKLTDLAEKRAAVRARRAEHRAGLVDAAALGTTILAPLKAAIGGAIEFESVMADVRKVVDFDTPEGFARMGDAIQQMSTEIPISAAGLGEIVAAAGQAGIARDELLEFARDAAMIGVAFDLSADQAGGAMSGLRSIFGLGQTDLVDLAGAFNHLSNNMDATAADLLTIANRAGSMGRLFGLSGQEVGALGATFLALKTPPEVAGTSINAMLSILATADQQPKKFADALAEIGVDATVLKDDIGQDAQGALLRFLDAVGGADDKIGTLTSLFGREYADDIAKLVGNLGDYRRAVDLSASAEANADSVRREYAARADTTANALTLMQNQFERLGNTVGEAFLPHLRSVVDVVGRVVEAATGIADRFPGATQAVVGLLGGLVGMKIAVLAGKYGLTFLTETYYTSRLAAARFGGMVRAGGSALRSFSRGPVIAAVRGLGAIRLAMLSTGVGAAIVALGVGAALVIKYWEPIKAFFGGLWAGIQQGIGPTLQAFAPLGKLFGFIGDAVAGLFGWLGKLFEPVESSRESLAEFGSTGERVGRIVGAIFSALLTPARKVVEGIGWIIKTLGLFDDAPPAPDLEPGAVGGPAPPRTAIAAGLVGAALAGAPAAAAPPPDAGVGAAGVSTATADRNREIDALTRDVVAPVRSESSVPRAAQPSLTVGDISRDMEAIRREVESNSAVRGGAGAAVQPAIDADELLRRIDSDAPGFDVADLPARPVSITVNAEIVIQSPPGADTAGIAREIERQLADIMRRAADEARLAEADGV